MIRKTALMLFTLLIVLSATGCTQQDWLDLADIGKMWAVEHKVLNDDGTVNKTNAVKRYFGFSTGDSDADAVLDAGIVVKNFVDAEKLYDEGVNTHDLKKLNSAIAMRPGEFRYYNERGAYNYFEDSTTAAQKDFSAADSIASKYGKDYVKSNLHSRIDSLHTQYTWKQNDMVTNGADPSQLQQLSKTYHEALIQNYTRLWELTDDPDEKASYRYMIDTL